MSTESEARAFAAPAATNVLRLPASLPDFPQMRWDARDLLNALPAAVYTTDADGRITFYNEAAVRFAGRRPAVGEMWCVTWRLLNLDGSVLPHDECPMAICLKERREVRGAEAIAERPDGTRVTFTPFPTPLFDKDGKLIGAINMLVDISERKAAEEHRNVLTNEVNHRANNLLAVVQSIVRLTKGEDVKTFQQEVGGRIQALAQAHNLLAESRWSAADLQRIATEELAPYMGEDVRAWLSGTVMLLRPTAAQAMALMLHELVTNAAKYGALSVPDGRVKLDWRFDKEGQVLIRWQEEGGPVPNPSPARTGVGTTMIKHAANQLDGVVTYDWRPTGLALQLRAPAASMITAEAPH